MGFKDILIRKVQDTDIEKLVDFFKKSYGSQTIFQNKKFLLYYFGYRNNEQGPFKNSLIGLTGDGEIVSHYGGLLYNLKIENVRQKNSRVILRSSKSYFGKHSFRCQ